MMMNRQAIRHKTFGDGIVTDFTDSTITVCFPDGEKKFLYPDAFKDHLVLRNKKLQQQITAQIVKSEEEINMQRQTEQAAQERRQKLLTFSITANSHAVFDILPEHVERICKTYTVSAGRYVSGYSKGQPRIAKRLKPNSVCLLTVCSGRQAEAERQIVGAFMVKEDFFGENVQDEFIEGHPEYQMRLLPEKLLPFWEHFGEDAIPRWGSTVFKYCSAAAINRILAQMLQMLQNTEQQEPALAFYRHFCKMNRMNSLIKRDDIEKMKEKP